MSADAADAAASGELLASLPPEQPGAAAWYGPDMMRRTDWIVPLDPGDIAEIEAAVAPLAASSADIASLTRADFPLPTLARSCSR